MDPAHCFHFQGRKVTEIKGVGAHWDEARFVIAFRWGQVSGAVKR